MNLVSEYTVNDLFCVFVGITFRKFSLYFSLFQDDVIASILYPCMLSSGILNLPIYGRKKQLKPCFVLKCVDLSTYKRIICIFQMAFSHPMVIIVCNGRGAYFPLLRQTRSYFQGCEIFLSCTSARQNNHVRFTGKCMLYSLCQLPPEFSMLFLFKINNSLYISFQSFINTQILTIGHIIT